MGLIVSCCMPGGNPNNIGLGTAVGQGLAHEVKPATMAVNNAQAQYADAYQRAQRNPFSRQPR